MAAHPREHDPRVTIVLEAEAVDVFSNLVIVIGYRKAFNSEPWASVNHDSPDASRRLFESILARDPS